ncbi:MAG TPA: CapA family protein [bacterium]|nr:CapA family protein [bacterium]
MFNKLIFIVFAVFLSCKLVSCNSDPVNKRKFVKNDSKDMVLLAGGDLVCASYVENAIKKYGIEYPFAKVKEQIEKADIAFANLECVISDKGDFRSKKINYGASLISLDSILYSGIDVFSIANNHVYDMDKTGLLRMRELLDRSPVFYGGSGKDLNEASEPVQVEVNGLKIAFLFYNSTGSNFCADKKTAGINCLPFENKEKALKTLKSDVKKTNKADIIILSVHWGPNYNTNTSSAQMEFAHAAIENGVDIILGHSAHIFHGIEIFNNKPIIYDMGDFLINDDDDWDSRSFLYNIYISDGKISQLELVPVYMPNSQIRVAEGILADEIISRFIGLSDRFKTPVKTENGKIIIDVQ